MAGEAKLTDEADHGEDDRECRVEHHGEDDARWPGEVSSDGDGEAEGQVRKNHTLAMTAAR